MRKLCLRYQTEDVFEVTLIQADGITWIYRADIKYSVHIISHGDIAVKPFGQREAEPSAIRLLYFPVKPAQFGCIGYD